MIRSRRRPRALLPIAAAVILLPAGLAAQEASPEPRVGCFRGQPLPHCSSFWIVELQGLVPLAQSERMRGHPDDPHGVRVWEQTLEWNVGHMWNASDGRWAFGPILSVGTQAAQPFSGLRARARRWFSDGLSLETGVGYVRADPSSRYQEDAPGVSADLRLNIRDRGALFLRWDRYFVESGVDYDRFPHYDEGGAQDAFLLGAGAGTVPALVGTGVLGVGLALLIGLYFFPAT